MKNQAKKKGLERKKIVAIWILYVLSAVIILIGVLFSIFSFRNQVSFPVLHAQIPGAVFGLVAAFLGVRYFLSVGKLKAEVYKTSSRFSWSNFISSR